MRDTGTVGKIRTYRILSLTLKLNDCKTPATATLQRLHEVLRYKENSNTVSHYDPSNRGLLHDLGNIRQLSPTVPIGKIRKNIGDFTVATTKGN
jgi:hypothetical protein